MDIQIKFNIVPLLSEAEFDANIGFNLNLTFILIYKALTKIVVTTTGIMVATKIASQTWLIMYRSQTALPILGTNNTQRLG